MHQDDDGRSVAILAQAAAPRPLGPPRLTMATSRSFARPGGPCSLAAVAAATLAAASACKAAAAGARAAGRLDAAASLLAAAGAAETSAALLSGAADVAEDAEVAARMAATRTCLEVQVRAARRGACNPRPRDVVDGGTVALRNLAVHDFDLNNFAAISPLEAKRRQRGRQQRNTAASPNESSDVMAHATEETSSNTSA